MLFQQVVTVSVAHIVALRYIETVQRGQIIKRNGAWHLRHYSTDIVDGKPVRLRPTIKLARVSEAYPTKASVALLAAKILEPINTGAQTPASAMRVAHFIEHVYFPNVKSELRPSTYKAYKNDTFEKHLKDKLGDVRLRDFQIVHGQRLLRQIAVGHRTLVHIKSFMSSVFKFARRQGILGTENPMRDVSVPGRPARFRGPAYNINQVEAMLNVLPGTTRVVVAVAALTGLRAGEIRGLRWADFSGDMLMVSRSVWRTHVSAPKTLESEAPVPCIPFLKNVLEKYRNGAADDAYIFAGKRRGQPLNLANLARRVLKPALLKAKLPWLGWHAFRRGLASNLSALGVQPIVITAIMRHSDPATAIDYYIKIDDTEAREAMAKLENAFWVIEPEE